MPIWQALDAPFGQDLPFDMPQTNGKKGPGCGGSQILTFAPSTANCRLRQKQPFGPHRAERLPRAHFGRSTTRPKRERPL